MEFVSEQSPSEESAPKRPKVRLVAAVSGITILLVLSEITFLAFVAFFPDAGLVRAVRRFVPTPVALVDGAFIAYGELDRNRDSLRRFYEAQSEALGKEGLRVDFDTTDGAKRLLIREKDILNKMIDDRVVFALAKDRGISIATDDIRSRVEEAIGKDSSGSVETLEENLRTSYGWSIDEFERRIVEPSLYREALEKSFDASRDAAPAKKKIAEAAKALRSGQSFEDVARKFSDGASKEKGGDLGTVDIAALVPELQAPAETQTIGEIGTAIESSLGFHILVVSARPSNGNTKQAMLKQIFVAKPSFPEWISEEKKKRFVFLLPRRYIWNGDAGLVEFRGESLRAFEEESLRKADGDPSIIL